MAKDITTTVRTPRPSLFELGKQPKTIAGHSTQSPLHVYTVTDKQSHLEAEAAPRRSMERARVLIDDSP
eukprot:1465138-Rhodomonas_salina.3